MNTVRSFWLGWGSLCVAGGGAYYFAKREINADRQAKLEAARNKKQQDLRSVERFGSETSANDNSGGPARTDTTGSSSQESGRDPAAGTEADRAKERSKYESAVPYTSRKGDRFS